MTDAALRAAQEVGRRKLIVWWELRAWRLRLALAENDIAWAQAALSTDYLNPDGALAVLDRALGEFTGDDE